MDKVTYIDEVVIKNKIVLLRVDFNVSLNSDHTIADDARIRHALPTIQYLLKGGNRLRIISHLDRPGGKKDPKCSLKKIVPYLKKYFPQNQVLFTDPLNGEGLKKLSHQKSDQIILFENIRFYPGEKKNSPQLAKRLSELGEVFVNDAFGVSHRINASVVGLPRYLPAYGGILLKKEVQIISKIVKRAKKPVVAIIGGAKITTKINFINKLIEVADFILVGGGLANTFLCSQGIETGNSYCEYEKTERARRLLFTAAQTNTAIILPRDVIVGKMDDPLNGGAVKKIEEIEKGDTVLDIGPETQAKFGSVISQARTIIWNGPVGYIENQNYRRGTEFIYYAITQNDKASSLVGGGDTLAAISKEEYLSKITHISTGGGAMLEFIEKGTLPGIEALKKNYL